MDKSWLLIDTSMATGRSVRGFAACRWHGIGWLNGLQYMRIILNRK